MKKYLLILLLLSACASSNFSKEGITPAKEESDQKDCQYQAELATAGMPTTLVSGRIRESKLVATCMGQKGYINE